MEGKTRYIHSTSVQYGYLSSIRISLYQRTSFDSLSSFFFHSHDSGTNKNISYARSTTYSSSRYEIDAKTRASIAFSSELDLIIIREVVSAKAHMALTGQIRERFKDYGRACVHFTLLSVLLRHLGGLFRYFSYR